MTIVRIATLGIATSLLRSVALTTRKPSRTIGFTVVRIEGTEAVVRVAASVWTARHRSRITGAAWEKIRAAGFPVAPRKRSITVSCVTALRSTTGVCRSLTLTTLEEVGTVSFSVTSREFASAVMQVTTLRSPARVYGGCTLASLGTVSTVRLAVTEVE